MFPHKHKHLVMFSLQSAAESRSRGDRGMKLGANVQPVALLRPADLVSFRDTRSFPTSPSDAAARTPLITLSSGLASSRFSIFFSTCEDPDAGSLRGCGSALQSLGASLEPFSSSFPSRPSIRRSVHGRLLLVQERTTTLCK